MILGTGGSSKAVEYILKKLGIEFLFVTRQKGSYRQERFIMKIFLQSLLQEFTIVINTTPLGMYPNVDGYPKLPYESVSDKNYFFDLIYNPAKTLFLSKGRSKGAAIENGMRCW